MINFPELAMPIFIISYLWTCNKKQFFLTKTHRWDFVGNLGQGNLGNNFFNTQ